MSSSAPQPDTPWRFGTGVLLSLLLAKTLILTSIGLPFAAADVLAFFWQDIATAAIVGVTLAGLRPRAVAPALCGAVIAYVAVGVPIAAVLGSPLTWTMLRAARGALSDSIRHHLTLQNLGLILAVCGAGLLGMRIAGALTNRLRVTAGTLLLGAMAMGIWASPRVDTIGLDRNALTALLPRARIVGAASADAAARRSPFPEPHDQATGIDLASYLGAARGMNVLLIVLESTGAQYLKAYGAPDDPMPTVTGLATHALVYDRAYAAYPESVKGLYATLCGRMPIPGRTAEEHAALPCASIARSFGQAGYRTGLFHSGRFAYLGMAELLRDKGFARLEDAGAIGGHARSSFGVDESAAVDRILAWIDDGGAATPFFAAYLPVAGHHPYATSRPGPFAADTDMNRYRNALHEADEAVGQLLQGLRDRGIDRRTMVMIVGDHGEAFGQHQGNMGHSLFIYEENVHVPWMVAVPGRTGRSARVSSVASLVDVPSTLRDLAGLGDEAVDEGRGLGRRDDPIALFFTDYSLTRAGLRDGCWTYLYEADADRSQLFDVCGDPGQTHDRHTDEPLRVAAYRARVTTAILGQSGNMVGQGEARIRPPLASVPRQN